MSIQTDMWENTKLDKARFTIHMNYRKTLRDIVEREHKQLFKQFILYTTTRSKFCPLVYDTCDQIINEIRKHDREESYLKLLSDIEDSIGTSNEIK